MTESSAGVDDRALRLEYVQTQFGRDLFARMKPEQVGAPRPCCRKSVSRHGGVRLQADQPAAAILYPTLSSLVLLMYLQKNRSQTLALQILTSLAILLGINGLGMFTLSLPGRNELGR